MGHLVQAIAPLAPDTPCDLLFIAFAACPQVPALPLVLPNGDIRLINRVAFFSRFEQPEQLGPWRGTPLDQLTLPLLVNRSPLVLDSATPVTEAARSAVLVNGALSDGLVVTHGGTYIGMVLPTALLACVTGNLVAAEKRPVRPPSSFPPSPFPEAPSEASAVTSSASDFGYSPEDQEEEGFLMAPLGMFRATFDGRILAVNPALARLYGHENSQTLRASLTAGLQTWSIDPSLPMERLALLEQPGAAHRLIYQIRRENGDILWVLEVCRACQDQTGDARWVEGFVIDITEHTWYEYQFAREQVVLRATLENMDQGIMMTGQDQRLIAWNHRACELLGLEPDFLKEQPTLGMIGSCQAVQNEFENFRDPLAEWDRRWGGVLPEPGACDMQEWTRPDGRVFEVRTNGLLEGGHVRTITDITARIRAQEDVQTSRRMLRAVIDAIPARIDVKDMAGRFQLLNEYEAEFIGLDSDQVYGKTLSELLEFESPAIWDALDLEAIRTGEALPFCETEEIDSAGDPRAWISTKVPLKDQQGTVTYVVSVTLDITELKQAEADLAKERAFLRATLENMDQAIIMMDRDMRVVDWNLRCVDLLGLPDTLLETCPTMGDIAAYFRTQGDATHDTDTIDAQEQVDFWSRQGRQIDSQAKFERRRPDGTVIEVRTNRLPGRGFVCTFTDITERTQKEELVLRHREQLRAILDASPLGVCMTERNGGILWSNNRFADLCGVPRDRLLGMPRSAWYTDPHHDQAIMAQFVRAGSVRDYEVEFRSANGSRWWALMSLDPMDLDGGPAIVGWLYDITARRRMDEALRQSEERLKLAVGATLSGVWDTDFTTGEHWWSPEFARLLGYEVHELSPREATWTLVVHPDDRIAVQAEQAAYLAGRQPAYHAVFRMVRKDGSVIWAGARGHALRTLEGQPYRFTGIISDITERRRAEDALRTARESLVQAEKMASLGGLVAGVAHEINTPIGTAFTAASHLADRTGDFVTRFTDGTLRKTDARAYVGLAQESTSIIVKNIARAAELIQSFKQVAVDQSSDERRRFDLKHYVDEVLVSLRPRLRKVPHTVTVLMPPDIAVDSYPGALSQVLTNLIMNALLHAFREDACGTITIAAELAPEDDWVRMVFEDNGRGISARHLSRIFDPFFTTRRGSGGTGLGLHIVYNIITQRLGGTIRCESEEGHGTKFVVRFPRVAPEAVSEVT